MATRKPKPVPETKAPDSEIIGGIAISIDGRVSITGGTPRQNPTHDDEW